MKKMIVVTICSVFALGMFAQLKVNSKPLVAEASGMLIHVQV